MDIAPSTELYRKYIVEDPSSKLVFRVVMAPPTRSFLLALLRARLVKRDHYYLEKKMEKYLEDQPFP